MRKNLAIILAVIFLVSCAPTAVPLPLTETDAPTAMPTVLPTATPEPDISINLKDFIYDDRVVSAGETLVLDNSQNADWAGTTDGPYPIEGPFRLKIQYSMAGDFGGITFYGAIKTPDTDFLPRLVVGPVGQIGFIDDQNGNNQQINMNVGNGEPFFLDFLDPQGKQIEVVSESGAVLNHIDVTRDLTGMALPDGLFPNGEFYFGIQAAPKSKLIISQLSLEVRQDGVYGAAADTKCSLSVGDQEIVLSNNALRAAGLSNWPDTIMGVWRDGDKYHFLAANPLDSGYLLYSALTTGTLDNPLAISVDPNISIQDMKHSYGYIGGGPVYRDPQTGTLLMIYDTERYPQGGSAVHNIDGMAKSADNGKTWTDLGEILDTEFPGWADWNVGVGNGPFVINGEYFYVYLNDTLIANPRFDIGFAVARAKVKDVLNAAINENRVVPWTKYYQGEWGQPGLVGKSSPLEVGNPQSTMFDVSYNEYLGRYIKINQSDQGGSTNLFFSESPDGIHWSFRVPIDESVGDKIYPTIIGLGDNPQITGAEFYVYYVFTPDWQNTAHANKVLARRKISCSPAH
jgi:hypothetical protein